ncbi:MAG: efflux RND transporter periplasmic adaptor subunit [Spirochaetaceae bacterium]|jgi:multidrug efflux pump subunit AcrA (membrane-fusion protein)|nr:efflux RND transporter periplasmic adaptor subunit [Spirochaetaceae bacterium]
MSDPENRSPKKYRPVTLVIALLSVVIAVLIGVSLLGKKTSSVPSGEAGGAVQGRGGGAVQAGGQERQAPQGMGIPDGAARSGRNATVVRVTPVVLGLIENYVVINGDVLASSQVSVFPTVGGRLAELRLRIGDTVERGTVIAAVDPSRPGETYALSPVPSTVSGTIVQLPVNPGDTVTANTVIAVVGGLGDLVVETYVPERYAALMRRGLGAEVRFSGLGDEPFAARVDELSPVLDPESRTRRITLRFARQDSRIMPGMFATISLVTHARSSVPVIPRASVINSYGSWFVFVVDEASIARRREVVPGLENENYFEIVNGLEIGEQVVTAGQNFLSDNEPVRVVE